MGAADWRYDAGTRVRRSGTRVSRCGAHARAAGCAFVCALAVAALLAACGVEHADDGAVVLTQVTEADSGGTVRVRAGEELEVRLTTNPSTGHAWSFPPVDGLAVATVEPPPPTPGASPTALGAPVTLVLKVKATAGGTYTFEGFYRRLWEPPPDTGPDFVLTIEALD